MLGLFSGELIFGRACYQKDMSLSFFVFFFGGDLFSGGLTGILGGGLLSEFSSILTRPFTNRQTLQMNNQLVPFT